MAQLNVQRMYAYGGAKMGQGPPRLWFPVESSQTGYEGRLVSIAGGQVQFTEGTDNTMTIGILEVTYTSAKATNTPVGPITLALPWRPYVGTQLDAAAVANVGTDFKFKLNTTIHASVVDSVAATTSPRGCTIVGYPGYQWGYAETHAFVGRNDTAETSGASNYPMAQAMGTVGDTNARVIFFFEPEGLALYSAGSD